ncbi:MAG TPA: alpha/beta hydrolase [Bacteroidales bacterium]|nr:alpha/beta hydrolase [Bacteroidales bacterium]
MSRYLTIRNKKIHYIDIGKGYPVILLHGYLESISVWSGFAQQLSKKFRVIALDIPGHGKSESLDEKHTMEKIATHIYAALKKFKINQGVMIGHSMGGYVTLMLHHLYPELLSGFSLFHSHPFADTEETRKNRIREIDLVKKGKKDILAKINIPNAFAQHHLLTFKNEVERAKAIALQTNDKGIIANLHAMMNRPDFSDELAQTETPFLLIAGKHDNYIPFDTVIPNIKLPENSTFCVLENSGHMGFVEEKEKTLDYVERFVSTIEELR